MVGSYLGKRREYHNLDGYEPVIDEIESSCISGEFYVRYIDRHTYYYLETRYNNLEAALEARRQHVERDRNRETHGFVNVNHEHPMEHQESIFQNSVYKVTFTGGHERHRQLEYETFTYQGLNYTTLAEAQQVRNIHVRNLERDQRLRQIAERNTVEYGKAQLNIITSYLSHGQVSITAAKKGLDILKKLIDNNEPSIGNSYKPVRASLKRHLLAEEKVLAANILHTGLANKSKEEQIAVLQEIKDLYAQAMDFRTTRIEFYRAERAKINVEKNRLEVSLEAEKNQARQQQSQSRAAPRVDNSPSNEHRLYQEATELAQTARRNPSIENYDAVLKIYEQLIDIAPKNEAEKHYKPERADLYREKLQIGAPAQLEQPISDEQRLYQQATVLAQTARSNPSIENYDAVLKIYEQLIDIAPKNEVEKRYKPERADLYREKLQIEYVHSTITSLEQQIENTNLAQRIEKYQELITFCERSASIVNLQSKQDEARSKMQLEQGIFNKVKQVTDLFTHINVVNGRERLDRFDQILSILNELIEQAPKEVGEYEDLRTQVNQNKSQFIQEAQQQALAPIERPLNHSQLGFFNLAPVQINHNSLALEPLMERSSNSSSMFAQI